MQTQGQVSVWLGKPFLAGVNGQSLGEDVNTKSQSKHLEPPWPSKDPTTGTAPQTILQLRPCAASASGSDL